MAKFPSDEWVKALMDELNKSESYRQAAKTWEGDFYFIVDPGGAIDEEMVLYVDLWHGKCRDAFRVADRSAKEPEFVISAPESVWRRIIGKQLDAIQGMMTRQLKLEGNMVKIMKAVKAAKELVECTTQVPTEFHE